MPSHLRREPLPPATIRFTSPPAPDGRHRGRVGLTAGEYRLFSRVVGMSPPKPVVERKTGTVPDRGRVLAAGDCPEFSADLKVYLSPDYKEEQLRQVTRPSPSIRHSSFVIRTLPHESLGWDVANKAGLTEVYRPVIHEESIRVAGATKAPDYTFRIGGMKYRDRVGVTR